MTRQGFRAFPAVALLAVGALRGQTAPANTKSVPSETVIVRKNAVEPATITRAAGPFVLYLENRTGNPNESYRVDEEGADGAAKPAAGGALASMTTQENKWWDHRLIDLPPGTYRLSVGSRSDLKLQLVITK